PTLTPLKKISCKFVDRSTQIPTDSFDLNDSRFTVDSLHRSVHFHELFYRKRLGPLQYLAGAVVSATHLSFFFLGKCHDPKREYLVDLSSIKKTSSTFGRNLRIVVEDDRRRQHAIVRSLFSGEHRIRTDVVTIAGRLRKFFWRIKKRNELAVVHA